MRCVASRSRMALGFGPHSASTRLSSADRAVAPCFAGQRRGDAAQRGDVAVTALVDQALPVARRSAGAELQRVVDHREIALVVQEAFVGGDFGVDANPEIHVLLDAFGPRNGFGVRRRSGTNATGQQPGCQQGHQGAAQELSTVGLIYTRWRACKLLIQKEICVTAQRYVAHHPGACVEDFDSRACPADVTYCRKVEFCVARGPARAIGPRQRRQIPLAQHLLLLVTSGSTKTASDNNKKSGNTPPQTSKQATNRAPRKRGFFFLRSRTCNPARARPSKWARSLRAEDAP